MIDLFSDEGVTEIDRAKDGLVVRCRCDLLVSLVHRSKTATEKRGYVTKVTSLKACYAGICACGEAYRTEVDRYERDALGKLVLV